MEYKEIKEVIDKFFIENDERNHYFNANYPDCILVESEKGGYSGGSCWNDDPAEPYEKESYEIERDVFNELNYRLYSLAEGLNINLKSKEAQNILSVDFYKLNEVHERHTDEYYGNSRTDAIYAIKLIDILEQLLTKEEFEILESSLHDFILEKKPELLEEKQENKRKFR